MHITFKLLSCGIREAKSIEMVFSNSVPADLISNLILRLAVDEADI